MVDNKQDFTGEILSKVNALGGDLPINALLNALDGFRINHKGVTYCLYKRVTYTDIKRVSIGAYVIKRKGSNKRLKKVGGFKK